MAIIHLLSPINSTIGCLKLSNQNNFKKMKEISKNIRSREQP
jgi:hypothetical protein